MQTSGAEQRTGGTIAASGFKLYIRLYILLGWLFLLIGSLSAQNEWDVRMSRSSLDCAGGTVCYDIELQSASGGAWTLGDQNYRLFFDGDLMSVTSVTSLLPGAFYGTANIDQNLKFTGVGQEAASPLDDIDDHLGFLDFSIVQNDKTNPSGAVMIVPGTYVPTARICIDAADSALNGNDCLSFYHSRESTAGQITTQYMTITENNMAGSTIATTGAQYNDLTASSGTEACLRVPCHPEYCLNLDLNVGDVCDDGDAGTENDRVGDDCICRGDIISADRTWDIRLNRSSLDCEQNSVCYQLEVKNTSGADWTLGDQNYRLFFDGDLMTVRSVTSLLPTGFYGAANIDMNQKSTGAENASPLNDIDDNLGFLDFSIVQTDKTNPISAVRLSSGIYTSTAEICVDVTASVINDGACLSFYHSRPSTAGSFTNQYTTITENDEVSSTRMTSGMTYDDLTSSDGAESCIGTDCYDCPDLQANIGDVCDDNDPTTENDRVQGNCICKGSEIYDCPLLQLNIGDSCDDGDSTTENDRVGDDCSCSGTPISNTCEVMYEVSGDTIRITNIVGNIRAVKVFDQSFAAIFSCDDWTTPCNENEEVIVPGAGTYFLQVQTYADWSTPVCNLFETIVIGTLPPPGPCSIRAEVSNIVCDDRGTASTADDTYSFDLTAEITNGGGWGYDVVGTPHSMQPSGSTVRIEDLLISAGAVTYTVKDHDINNCTTTLTVTPPTPCSSGSSCAQSGGDADGDGVCANEDCDDNNASISQPGDACNDNNPDTVNDEIQSDCSCQGTGVSSGCNAMYEVSGNEIRITNILGNIRAVKVLDQSFNTLFACDDWTTVCNETESITVPGAGTYYVQIQTYADWSTPVCNIFETVNIGVNPPGPCSISAEVSNIQCDDRGTSDPSDDTYSFDVRADIINGGDWGYDIEGTSILMKQSGSTFVVSGGLISHGTTQYRVRDHDKIDCFTTIVVTPPAPCSSGSSCASHGGDADGDGVCADEDCDDNNANISRPGDACDDNNPNTINDEIQSDCSCKGTPVSGSCNVNYEVNGLSVTVSNLRDAIVSVKLLNANWQIVEECSSWTNNTCGQTVSFTAPNAGRYYLQVQTYADWSTPVCNLLETLDLNGSGTLCRDFTNPGLIKGDETLCTGETSGPIYNLQYPSGGNGAAEYMWIKNTEGCGSTDWEIIPSSNTSSYDPGVLTETTYYKRCTRRVGCTQWNVESNCVIKTVDEDCGDGKTDCKAAYEITGNTISVNGLTAPINSLNILDLSWNTVYACNDWTSPCNAEEVISSLTPGTYYVQIKTYVDWFTPVCDIFETVTVGGAAPKAVSINTFDARLKEGVVELDWTNNTGYKNDEFEVERSVDGVNFGRILSREPLSSDDSPKHYRGADNRPNEGYNYYRLKTRYLDGTTSYSEIRKVRIERERDFGLYPNPAGEYVHIDLREYEGKDVELRLTDGTGHILSQVELKEVNTAAYRLDLSGRQNGLYTVSILTESRKAKHKKLIIARGY